MQDKNQTAQTQVMDNDVDMHNNTARDGGTNRRSREMEEDRATTPQRKVKYARREEYAPW